MRLAVPVRWDSMSLVATDGHRLALVTCPRDGKAKKDGDEDRPILPKKTLGELGRLLTEGDGDITYERGENHLFFRVGDRLTVEARRTWGENDIGSFACKVRRGDDVLCEGALTVYQGPLPAEEATP